MHRLTLAATLSLLAAPAAAQTACTITGDPWDLPADGVAALYACMAGQMVEGYGREGDPVATAYRGWTPTATRPALAGPHGERFLYTFANTIAAPQYTRYATGAFEMPVGSVLAKESITLRDGAARVGPLFVMTKVADAPETDNWVYAGIQPNGKPLKISQSFCHDCHGVFEDSDSMGYPLEEVRLSN